ncbi:uncharacterized protein zp3c [Engraulis encrasicolus]|uniref:uncharacterized protein zp3c n=1 Tax=Engraulis encrasicolus TaxID=184585 RepID=UPI002FD2A4C5
MISGLPLLLLLCLNYRTEGYPVEYVGTLLGSDEYTPTAVEYSRDAFQVEYSATPEETQGAQQSRPIAADTDDKPDTTWEELQAMISASEGIGAGWSEVSVDSNFKTAAAEGPAFKSAAEGPTFKSEGPALIASAGGGTFGSLSNPTLLNLPMFSIDMSPLGSGVFRPEEGTRHLPEAVIPKLLPPTPTDPAPPQNGKVDALCHLDRIYIRIRKDLFSYPENARQYLRVGPCPVNQARGDHYYFLYYLNNCSRTFMDGNLFSTYSSKLTYNPPSSTGVVLRDLPFSVDVNCKYYKNFNAYAYGPNPDTRSGTLFTRLAQASRITLTLHDDQWNPLAPGEAFSIGRPMFFQVKMPPRGQSGANFRSKTTEYSNDRVYVNKCYMTAASDPNSMPRYTVINQNGCMEDSKAISSSRFIPSPDQSRLRFSVGAFVFRDSETLPSGLRRLYMHCQIALGPSTPTPSAKSCTFNSNTQMWTELSGANHVCACCATSSCPSDGSGANKMVTSLLWDEDGKEVMPEMMAKAAAVPDKAAMPDKMAKAADDIDADDSYDEFMKYWVGN